MPDSPNFPLSNTSGAGPRTALDQLQQQLRLLEGVASTTPDFLYVFDPQGRFQYANRRLLEVWGMKISDVVGRTCRELGYEQWHHDMHMREIAQVIKTRQPIKGEVPFKAPATGIFGVYEYIFTPVFSAAGDVELIAGITRDVTDRKQIQETLSDREERYRELFTSMTDGFCVIERVQPHPGGAVDFRFIETNPSFVAQSGLQPFVGQTLRQIVPAEADQWIALYDRVIESGEPIRLEREMTTLSRTLELYAYPLPGKTRPRVGVVFRNITERRLNEQKLRRNHDTFYHLIQNNPFGIYVVDADFRLRQVSAGAQKVFAGVRPLLDRDFAEVLRIVWDEPFATEAISRFRHTLATGEPYVALSTIEKRHDIAAVEAYDWRIERITLPDGRFGVVCYFYDLSERQRWESALRLSEERFQLAVRATNDTIRDWDLAANSIWWNDGAPTLFGYPAAQVPHDPAWWTIHIHPEDRDRVQRSLTQIIDGRESSWRAEYRFERFDGTYADIFDRAFLMRDADGKAVRLLGAMQDLSDRKRTERALAQAQVELKSHAETLELLVAERTAKLRETITELEALSYSISHDMRAPLRAMQGFSQALLDDYADKLDSQGHSFLQRISASASRLDSLIQDILLYTKVSREPLTLAPIALEPVLREIVQIYHPDQAALVKIVAPCPDVLAHAAFLSQILSNLITNALKFVPKGTTPRVTIRCETESDTVRIWIEDNGVGIAPQHLQTIFQVFGRVYSAEDYPGTGIGLAIVKRAVERLGGDVGVESQLGRGSRFWIRLQKAPALSS